MTDLAFNKLATNIIDSATSIKQTVAGASSLPEAIRLGYGSAINSQLSCIIATCMALQKMMQSNIPKGGYSFSMVDPSEIATKT
jgi:hypothetical protein